jgi:hypothetical protein
LCCCFRCWLCLCCDAAGSFSLGAGGGLLLLLLLLWCVSHGYAVQHNLLQLLI